MPEQPPSSISLVKRSASERMADFKRCSIAHRTLKEADNKLWQRIEEPGGASLIFVYGPGQSPYKIKNPRGLHSGF